MPTFCVATAARRPTLAASTSCDEAQWVANVDRRRKTIVSPLLLIVNEISYRPHGSRGATPFSRHMGRRHERPSTILTSKQCIERLGEVFGDDPMLSKPINRLVLHRRISRIRGNCFRLRQQVERRSALSLWRGSESSPAYQRPFNREGPAF